MLLQLHMLFASAADGATQSGWHVLGLGREGGREGGGIPALLSPSLPRGHPVQMGNRNDLEAAASVTSLGDQVSRQ